MNDSRFKYIYGPLISWRMGKSLGIDPLSDQRKICNLDCNYCQLGRSAILTNKRLEYVPTNVILDEMRGVSEADIDYITFSGRGEPTLAKNLGELIQGIRSFRKEKIAIITNSTLLYKKEVRDDCSLADLVMLKLDAADEKGFNRVDIPIQNEGITFDRLLEGIRIFRKEYVGKIALPIMFVKDNIQEAKQISDLVRTIDVDEVHINTPLRPSGVDPLSEEVLNDIKKHFQGLNAVTVYEKEVSAYKPYNDLETIKRHGNFKKQLNMKTDDN